jgi:peptidoglycan/LPS O-acetylase OafA/YrhL
MMERVRNSSIDAAKLLAAFGVVMIHLAPSTPVAELITRIFLSFAVPFFLTIALYYFIEKAANMERVPVSRLRLDRILIPYLVWTLIYLALRLIKYRAQHKALEMDIIPALFYGGTAVQMYFLPLLLLFQAQALAVILIWRGMSGRLAGVLVLIGAIAFGGFGSHEAYFGFQHCLERGCIYVFMALLLHHSQLNPLGRRINLFLGGIIAALTIVSTLFNYQATWTSYVGGPLAGYSIAALTLNLPFAVSGKTWRFLLTCSYGIYLAHVIFLESFEYLATRFHYELAPYSVGAKLLISLFITVCCILLIWFARLHRTFAYLLFGETIRS